MSSSPDTPPDAPPASDAPEFGPGGYLPARAARRARKIVLRERMGLGWPVAAVVAGLLILAVVIPLVIGGTAAPSEPYVAAGPLARVDPRADAVLQVSGQPVLVVRGGGTLAAFVDPPEGARYCAESRRIEAPGGAVWSLGGRALRDGVDSLSAVSALAYDDTLYLDLTSVSVADAATGNAVEAVCGS